MISSRQYSQNEFEELKVLPPSIGVYLNRTQPLPDHEMGRQGLHAICIVKMRDANQASRRAADGIQIVDTNVIYRVLFPD
jgi:hypothetical protein